eukprot:CAMPEP_0172613494 /NCGR_PEP_ID=MMETSP1068-20121228/43737_1 /TAXON_ID=35684 /ORGANISM="Pseudopedinella elastica, Strain CCMP716" /LENGTH=295 /DNA_ID=CAMNT_0013417965 /DNA_START=168 /DNA_END=1055 /DNA_ORIENTATION=+
MSKSIILALALAAPAAAWEDTCTQFSQIYTSGQDLCETMFGDAFKYETNEEDAFTMWWFEAGNPNNAVATKLNKTTAASGYTGECELEYFHKSGPPTAEGSDFTECHPWKDSACCYEATVTTPTALNEAYGKGYEWDRCGKMSQACERFFVQEACLYECDVNAGLYRKCTDAQAADPTNEACYENKWEMYKMPIKASYCDAWYDACYEDYFCGGEDGNFFSCAEYYSGQDKNNDDGGDLPGWGLILIIVLAVLLFLGCGFLGYTVQQERKGEPVFMPLHADQLRKEQSQPATANL